MPHNPKQTGKQAAHDASRQLKRKASTKTEKVVAASDLAQAPLKKKPGGKKTK